MSSDRLIQELRKSHTVVSYVDLKTTTNETVRLTAVDGSVSVDRSATVRRSCSIKCVDPLGKFTPNDRTSDLAPYGSEIIPYRGVKYSDGTEEVVPLGVFRISRAVVSDSAVGGVEISIEAYDRSRTIQRDKFVDPYLVEGGTNVVAAIKAIVERTFPDVQYDSITSDITTTAPRLYDSGDDPWEAVQSLGLSIGCDTYFDVFGKFVIAPYDDESTPLEGYEEGSSCVMVDLSQEFTDNEGYNGVVVEGESLGDELPPVRAVVWDDDPLSPTYHLGPYGEFPYYHKDSVVKTQEEAQTVGRQVLTFLMGVTSSLSVSGLVNPDLEGGMLVKVHRSRSNVTGLYVIESFNVPMRESTQQLGLRRKREA